MWDGEGFSPSAVSQIETKTLRNALLNNQFTCYTNYHSGTEIISYPWSYRTQSPRDLLHIDVLAAAYSSTSGYPGGLQYGQGYNVMYAINGSTKDFVYGSLGNVGWSVEISMDKQPPASQVQYYYDVNKPAMLEITKQCGWGVTGTVTDSVTGAPVSASVWVNNYYPVYTDPVVGDYHKFMATGYYTMTVTANGYKSKTVSGIIVPPQGTVTTNFQLVPDTGWYAFKLTSCRIPGNNSGDEGYTPGCIGKPDGIPYAMGRNGWVTLDLSDTLYNGPGMDFKVYQSGTTNKSFTVSGSLYLDGPYTTIGTGSGTTAFELPSQLGKLRYLYIKDNGTGSASGTGAGFNLDAIAMITPPLKVSFTANNQTPCAMTSIDFTDQSSGNPVTWEWSFPGAVPSTSNLQNPTGIYYNTPGTYPVTLTISNGVSSLTRTVNAFISVASSPTPQLGNDTLICDNQQLTLDAGATGWAYLWSTGATTQSITVDSTGTGYGTATYWVLVNSSNGCTGSDTIQVTYDECTAIPDQKVPNGITVSPNPASATAKVKISGLAGGHWRILQPGGTVIRSGLVRTNHEQIILDVSLLPQGVMILVAENDHTVITRKIVVVKP
jgi:PKD repeat protein